MAHPEVDDIISEVSITLESDRLTTTPGPIPSPSPQSPPLPAAVKARHHSCDESLHGIRHGSHSASRDASLQYSPQIEQGRELTSATYDNKVEGGPSPPPLHAHDAPSPYLVPAGRRRSRRIAAHRKAYYGDESDNDMDVDYVDSHDDKISLATGVEGGGEGVSDEDEQPACKRRKSSMSSAKKIGSEAARVRRSHRAASPSRVIRRSTNGREQMRTAGVASSASSEAASSETDLATILARCREWPLENVLLKCTTDDGNPIFQLQFNLPPRILGECTSYFASSRLESPSARVVSKARRIPSARLRYTPSEDDLLLQLKAEEKLPWPEIHQRFCEKFPGRPIPSLQVHYSTKVKPRERS